MDFDTTRSDQLNALTIVIIASPDGEGYDVDARSTIHTKSGNMTRTQGWVWSGWAETPKRAAEYAASEWEYKRSHL